MEKYHAARKDDRSEFQRDYDRLIFSAPFRRLQNKTQVFPLPGSVFVHNRLTHSLEVSCVGRSLGNNVARDLIRLDPSLQETHLPEIGPIVSAACLAHDLGNPPFGHSGERAISTYFSEGNGQRLRHWLENTPGAWEDFTHFEGNANAFRLLTHQFEGRREGGFVMTYTTLASIVKYPYSSRLAGEKLKFGFFLSEEEVFRKIADELGLLRPDECRCRHPENRNGSGNSDDPRRTENSDRPEDPGNSSGPGHSGNLGISNGSCGSDGSGKSAGSGIFGVCAGNNAAAERPLKYARHPLVYLVEAADDICYQVMDIEDAHKLRLITTKETTELFLSFFDDRRRDRFREVCGVVHDVNEQVAYLRSAVIGLLVDECSRIFVENEKRILSGTFGGTLIKHLSPRACAAYENCTRTAFGKIYRSRDVLDIELAGFRIIHTLVDMMIEAVMSPEKAYSRLLIDRVSGQYNIHAPTLYGRIQAVLDYISGMTDVYALDLYRKINGNSLPAL